MPCLCAGHRISVIRALPTRKATVHKRHSGSFSSSLAHARCQHPPGLTPSQTIAQAGHRTVGSTKLTLCRAQKQEEKEKDMVGGFDVDAEPGFLESEAVGIIFRVSSLCMPCLHLVPGTGSACPALVLCSDISLRHNSCLMSWCTAGELCCTCVRWSCSHIATSTTCHKQYYTSISIQNQWWQ